MDAKDTDQSIFYQFVVSIHAPVMDANRDFSIINPLGIVSIHAPVMDANDKLA